jgi:hypothetical protein
VAVAAVVVVVPKGWGKWTYLTSTNEREFEKEHAGRLISVGYKFPAVAALILNRFTPL